MSSLPNPKPLLASLLLQAHRWYVRIVIQGSLILATATLLRAGPPSDSSPDASVQVDQKQISVAQPSSRLLQDVSLDYTYVGNADLRTGTGGSLGEQTTRFGYRIKAPITEQWALNFGLNYNRLDFGQPAGSPLPYTLETLTASVGATYKISDQWSLFGDVAPRLELLDGWDQIQSGDVQVGGALGATYEANPNLSLRFGAAINPGTTGLPVMPLLGLRWRFADAWALNFGFPRTSIDYQILPNLRLSPIEIGFEGGSFHTDSTYGNSVGMPNLNDRNLNYREVRVGTGAAYDMTKNIQVGLNAGVVVYREFDFSNANYSPTVAPAPYVQLGAKVGF